MDASIVNLLISVVSGGVEGNDGGALFQGNSFGPLLKKRQALNRQSAPAAGHAH
jgi:hypothetical protein